MKLGKLIALIRIDIYYGVQCITITREKNSFKHLLSCFHFTAVKQMVNM